MLSNLYTLKKGLLYTLFFYQSLQEVWEPSGGSFGQPVRPKLVSLLIVSESIAQQSLDGKVMEIHWSNACLFGRPWKFEQIAIGFLSLMLRDDHPLPSSAVLFFVENLNHDSLLVRNVCLCVHSVTIMLLNICV